MITPRVPGMKRAERDWHECASGLLVRDGRMLMGLRSSDRRWLPGVWDVFGGHVEPGEDATQAIRRELQEELGIEVLASQPLGTLEQPAEGWRLQLHAVTQWRGEPVNRQPEEHACLQWVTRDVAVDRLRAAHAGFAALIDAAFATP